MKETMTREEILSELERLQPWFHCIDLGDGISTKTESVMGEPVNHPHGPWQIVGKCLPADLRGKTLLDVGCNAGFYAFEAKRRGAARVLGVDGQRQHVRQALFVRKVLGLEAEFRRMNVYELDPQTTGQFDITLALGLIYHLKHPILALENLFRVTKELLVVETAIMPPERTPPSFVQAFGPARRTLHPLVYVENATDAKEQVFNWFLPGIEALKALLRNAGFDEVEVVEAKDERAFVVCRKTKSSPAAGEAFSSFTARLTLEDGAPHRCDAGAEITFRLRAENKGLARWLARGEEGTDKGAVFLGAHLLKSDEEEVSWDYGRARLPHDMEPGEASGLDIMLRAPDAPGSYIVEFDLVAEHLTWFEDHGSGTLRHQLVVG